MMPALKMSMLQATLLGTVGKMNTATMSSVTRGMENQPHVCSLLQIKQLGSADSGETNVFL